MRAVPVAAAVLLSAAVPASAQFPSATIPSAPGGNPWLLSEGKVVGQPAAPGEGGKACAVAVPTGGATIIGYGVDCQAGKPKGGVTMQVSKVAFLRDSTGYKNGPDAGSIGKTLATCPECPVSTFPVQNLVFNMEKDKMTSSPADLKYAYAYQGGDVGSGEAGAYVGQVAYFAQSGSYSGNAMPVTYRKQPAPAALETTQVCVSKVTAGGTVATNQDGSAQACSEADADQLKYSAGDFKWSMFSMDWGSRAGLGAVMEGAKYYGIRVEGCVWGEFFGTSPYFNGDSNKDLTQIDKNGEQVHTITFKSQTSGTTMTMGFPTRYTYGNEGTYGGNKDVIIRGWTNREGCMWIDYLFDISDLKQPKSWFVYDPIMRQGTDVSDYVGNNGNNNSGGDDSSSIAAAVVVPLLLLAAAAAVVVVVMKKRASFQHSPNANEEAAQYQGLKKPCNRDF